MIPLASHFTNFFNVLDRAECVIRTTIHGDSPTARASLNQVRRAAAALSLTCAAGAQSQGGIALGIGQSHRDCSRRESKLAIRAVLIEAKKSPRWRQQSCCHSQYIRAQGSMRPRHELRSSTFLRQYLSGHASVDRENTVWS